MEQYIKSNKEAWEEAFDNRSAAWGADIVERIQSEPYAFFNKDTADTLRKYDLRGRTVGQFCCNNGRELLSLVKSTGAKRGVGFDIAENMIAFASEKAEQLKLPCEFAAGNILELDDTYNDTFDMMIITIGAMCWFKSLKEYFAVVSRCMKNGGVIVINEQHPATNMIATEDDEGFDAQRPLNSVLSYFSHEWTGNDGMWYITGKSYKSKTFTDYTHPLSDIIGAMCENGIVITGMKEFDYDISGMFDSIEHREFPLSMIIEGKKE